MCNRKIMLTNHPPALSALKTDPIFKEEIFPIPLKSVLSHWFSCTFHPRPCVTSVNNHYLGCMLCHMPKVMNEGLVGKSMN